FSVGQIAQQHLADSNPLQGHHLQTHQLTHAPYLAFATLTQYEAELISIGPRYLGRSQASVIQFKSVTEQGEGFFSHLARNAHEILLFHAAIFPDEGTRDGTVLCEYKQTCRVNIQ